jgi:hypothetical protein
MLDVIKRNTEAVESLQSELHSQRQAITRHIPSLSSSLPPEKEEWIETTELCSIYGKSRATVLAHARALGWDMRVAQAKTSGSLTFEYRVSCLPEKLRQAWAEKNVGERKEPTSAGQQESLFTPEGEVK